MNALRPVGDKLLDPLADIFRDGSPNRAIERSLATSILADYASKRPEVLADLVQDADAETISRLVSQAGNLSRPDFGGHGGDARQPPQFEADGRRERETGQARRTLPSFCCKCGSPKMCGPSCATPPTHGTSYFIHHIRLLQADPRIFIERLALEQDVSVRRALFLILGGYTPDQLSPNDRTVLLAAASAAYENDSDAGVHGAAEWLLSKWGQTEKLREFARRWRRTKRLARLARRKFAVIWPGRKTGTRVIGTSVGRDFGWWSFPHDSSFGWVLQRPRPSGKGGPEGDAEQLHWEEIPRSFAIAAREVTVDQFRNFRPDFDYKKKYAPAGDCPVNALTWYDAVAYCNWLSEKEGLDRQQWCYEPNRDGKYAEGMRLARTISSGRAIVCPRRPNGNIAAGPGH